MMMPSIFGENLFDHWMDFPFEKDFFNHVSPFYGKQEKSLMRTDIKETDSGYEVDIDLPGFKKEDVTAKLEQGYLMINAEKTQENEEQGENGTYIRRERYSGSCQRSFYVGETVTQEDIHAKFEDGMLKLSIPKKEAKQVEAKRYIAIEG